MSITNTYTQIQYIFRIVKQILIVNCTFLIVASAQQTIADGLPGCLDAGIAQVGMGCGGGTTDFGLSSGQFIVQNVDGAACCATGGDWNSYFEFEVIDISSFNNISISMDYSATVESYEDEGGGPYFGCTNTPIDNSHDQIVFMYMLDGGPFVQSLYVTGTTASDFTGTWNVNGLNGNSLRIRVYAANKASAEQFFFDNLQVTGFPQTISAGTDQSICEGQSVTLAGTGAGMWTGGAGSFSDPTFPTSSYTPAGGDIGNTITLTYAGNAGTSNCANFYPAPSDDMLLTTLPSPAIDPVTSISQCNSYTLPAINGTNLTGNEAYYTGTNGSGMSFLPGQSISNTTSLFIYDSAAPGCDDEVPLTVTITQEPSINPISNVSECGSYTLPAITGTNLTGNEAYFTGTNGSGMSFLPGQSITNTTSLFIYDSAATGCDDEVPFTVTITPGPVIDMPTPVSQCNSYTLPAITGSNLTGSQSYFSGPNGSGASFSPGQNINSSTSLFLFDTAGPGCSDEETLNITITPAPDIDMTTPVSQCNSYTLPAITGSNLTGSQSYFSGPNGSGTPYSPGQNINSSTSLFLFDTAGPGCSDEETLNITITPAPNIDMTTPVSQCNSYTLPAITGSNLTGSQSYFSGPNGSGTPYSPGQNINSSTSLFLFDTAGPGCSDEETLNITITPAPNIDMTTPVSQCNSYTLPAITGSNLTGSQSYFSGPNGSGTPYSPGQNINSSTSLFLFDTAGPGCSDEETLNITITPAPNIDMTTPVSQCNSYTLPAITGSNLTGSQSYFSGPNGSGASFSPGQNINSSTSLFLFDTAGPGCSDEETLNITITPAPNINPIADASDCTSYTLPAITGNNLSGTQAYYANPNGAGTIRFPGEVVSNSTALYAFDNAGPGCTDEEFFNIIVTPAPDVFPISDVTACDFYTLPAINGSNFSGIPAYYTSPGGTGISFDEGDVINNDIQLYAYAGDPGCEDEVPFSITLSSAPSLDTREDEEVCGGFTLPPITGSNLTGSQAYYTQSGGQGTSLSPGSTVETSGAYYIYDGTNGCEDEQSFFVMVLANLDISCSVVSNVTAGGNNGAIEVSIDAPTTGPYTISWSGAETGSITTSNLTNQIINLSQGSYNIVVEDAAGCTDNCSLFINNVSCNITTNLNSTPTSCANSNDGSINVGVTGASGFVFYTWNDPTIAGANPTGVSAGNYTVTVTDQDGCIGIGSTVVTAGADLVEISCSVISSASGPMAMDGTAQVDILTGTAPFFIDYFGPTVGNQAGVSGVNTINNLLPGVYNVVVTDNSGCSDICSFTVTDCGLIVDVITSNLVCSEDENGTIEIQVSGGTPPYGYDWENDAFDGMSMLTGLGAGVYTVAVRDQDECLVIQTIELGVLQPLEVNCNVIIPISAPFMSEGEADVLISGGTPPYTLDVNGNANFNFMEPAPGVINIDNLPGGYYTSTLTDANGCVSVCNFYIETLPCPMTADITLPGPLCEGDVGQIQISLTNATNPVVFDWSVDSLDGIQSPTDLLPGVYDLAIVDAEGCVVDTTLEIFLSDLKLFCEVSVFESMPGAADGEAELTYNGFFPPFEFTWSGPTNGSQMVNTSPGVFNLTGLSAGDYLVEMEDANGCVVECSFTMNATGCGATVFADVTPATCPNSSDGSIDITIIGGAPPFMTFWDNGESTEDISQLLPGDYEVKIIDANGCDFSVMLSVGSINPTPTASIMPLETMICPSGCVIYDLSFTGSAPYELSYNIESTTFDQSFTLSVLAQDTTIEICPDILGISEDNFTVQFTGIQDAVCQDTLTNSDDITIIEAVEELIGLTICEGDSVVINGTTYDADNTNGTEIIPDAAPNGCDSLLTIEVEILFPSVEDINTELCPGDSLIVNGVTYNENLLMGSDTIIGGNAFGCDSIINVEITYSTVDTNDLIVNLCEGDSIVINGTTYDENMTTGLEVLENASAIGCDSIINISLNFLSPDTSFLQPDLCPGETLVVNGTTYNEAMPNGIEVLENASANGCDSIVSIMLTYLSQDTFDFTTTICPGDSLVLNGTTYNETTPSGIEILSGASTNGCDSIVSVMIEFFVTDTTDFNSTICPGDSLVFNGTTYNEAMPNGIEVLPGIGINGCDSIVNVSLDFFTLDTFELITTICPVDDFVFNGTTYNLSNPSGIEVLSGAGANGCDSIVNVNLDFFTIEIVILDTTLCVGESIVVNGTTYNQGNTSGTEIISGADINGCDSIINVILDFHPNDINEINQQLCTGDSLIVNGTTYNETNPTGTETIPNGTVNGCDSTISVQLTFGNAAVNNIVQTLCPGDSIVVNGTTYNEAMPMGTDTIPNGSTAGCDSIISVMLNFFMLDTVDIAVELCPGDSLVVNGTTYNEALPNGTEVLSGAAANGCDSTINIMLTFFPPADTNQLMTTLCPGDSLIVNGTTFNESNPSGIEVLSGAAANGCDSIINIMLDFFVLDTFDLFTTICPGDSLIFNGTTYNEANSTGIEVLTDAAANGCDSIVNVMVDFFVLDTFDLATTICLGDSLIVNGTAYNETMPNGIEILSGAGANGCDSIINVMLAFFPNDTTFLNQQLCTGDSLIVNGTTYNEVNPIGLETIPDATINGCDSIISIQITFGDAAVNNIIESLCPGDSLIVNGTTYNEAIPMGSDTIPNGSIAGCDSIINVMLSFFPLDTTDLAVELCTGDSIIVNGTTYNEANPAGIEVLEASTTNGCDSTVNVMLSFFPLADTVDVMLELCTGDSLVVNGTTYNAGMPNGIEVLEGAAANGCDSIVNIMLTFGGAAVNDIVQTICAGDSLIVNGTTYNEAMPMGSDTIPNGSIGGCDSIINVMLSFFPVDTFDLSQQLCTGDSLIVNGTTYNEANPSGIELIADGDVNGCDSVINVMLTFGGAAVNDIVQTICAGDSLIVNGTTYNEAMPMGSDTIPNGSIGGCDSIINVMLSFFPIDTFELNQQLCTGDSLIVNGTTYNEANPSGIELIADGDANGCDSIINVMLTFGDAAVNDIVQTICAGDSLIVNGTTYNEAMPMGSDTIPNGSIGGCDSIINVMLSFFPIDTFDLNQQLCTGDSLIVNGTTYNEANPSGIELIADGDVNGCDSIINVMLTFGDAAVNDITQTICAGDSLIVNGTTYNEAMPMGSDTIPNGSIGGCDSIINVMLSFFPIDTFDLNQQLCTGDSLIVNGTTYNEANPTGIELIADGDVNGCDSIINVMLTFGDAAVNDITQTICAGDSLIVNGTTYNEAMPMGSDTIPNGSIGGCDSIINVMLSFFPIDTFELSQQLCTGDSLIVNGTTYNEANPTGIELIADGDANGCDSIINVMLTFGDAAVNDIVQTICAGDSLIVNGTTYNEAMPMGSDTIPNGSIGGCDSIINVMLSFFPIDTFDLSQQLCTGDSLIVNGTTYNEANPTGIELIADGDANGCDSIINVMLTFGDAAVNDIVQTICAGDSLIVNGTTYNEAMPMGSDTIPNGSIGGCDSIINVMLSFFPIDTFDLNQQLCTGDSLIVNGTTYNEANPSGIELIADGDANGCDSIINVMLTFGDAAVNDFVQTICAGDSLIVNGTTYNEAMPMGSDTIPNGSIGGCDSIINVMLSFFPIDTFDLNQQLCTGDSLIVNGTTYNEANPTGIELIADGDVNGCDSIINVMLTFEDAAVNDIVQTICAGDSLIVNGTTYNEDIPMGSDTIPNGSIGGCDSIINVMLSFFPIDTFDLNQQLCTGDSLIVNGTTYNEANPSGIEVIANGDTNGCDSIINVMLTFIPSVTANIADTLCAGEFIVVNGTTYNGALPSGQEIIEGGSINGCDSIINVNLTFIEEITGFLEGDAVICAGDSAVISIQTSSDNNELFNVFISDGSTIIENFTGIMNGFTFTVNPLLTTTYSIDVITVSGNTCDILIGQSVTVTVESGQADAQLLSDYDGFGVSCADSEDGSVGVIGSPNASYNWNTGSTDSMLTDIGAGTYFVTVSTPAGCPAFDSVVVTAPPPVALKANGIAANCLDSLNGSIFIESLLGGTAPFEYSLDGAFFQTVPNLPATIPNITPGNYDLIIQDINDCQVQASVFVGTASLLELELGDDENIKLGDSIRLNPTLLNGVLDTFFWTPPIGLITPFDFDPFAKPLETTTYQLTVLDSIGCSTSDQLTIFVSTEGSVYAPSVFSPNEDGRNDFFTIFAGDDVAEIIDFQIFDRWGNQVFKAGPMQPNNELLGWNGNFNGEPMNPAVFVFFAEIQFVDGRTEIIKGDVTLLR